MPELDKLIQAQEHKVKVARQLWHVSKGASMENTRHAKYAAEQAELERLQAMQAEVLQA